MNKCRDCAHLVVVTDVMRDKSISRCAKGHWDLGHDQWYSLRSVQRNAPTVRGLGAMCDDFQQRTVQL